MDITQIQYRLIFVDGTEKKLELHMRSDSLLPLGWVPSRPEKWAALEYHKCLNCPLDPEKTPFCPAALALSKLVEETKGWDLLDTIKLKVTSAGRTVSLNTSIQKALGSFIGLLMATSDCPHASFFRPLARYHYPLASEGETMFRSVTAFLLAQYFREKSGQQAKFDLAGLYEVYKNLEVVNASVAGRLKNGSEKEVVSQCMMEWDVFSGMFPLRVEELLKELRPLFAAYLSE
ncbi:DUF6901 family protein [Pseudomonadota bacterium]